MVSLLSERSARSPTSPGRVSERPTLPLLGLGRGCSRRTQRAFGTAMRLCASLFRRRRGPAGLRDLFRFCRNCGVYALRSGPFRVCEARVVSLPSACFACSRNAGRPLVKKAHLPFFLRPLFTFAKDPAGYCQYPHLCRYPTADCNDRTFSSHKLPNTSSSRNSRT